MGVMVVALFVVLRYNEFLTEPLILVTAGPIEVGGVFGVFWFISMDEHVYLYPNHLVCTRPFRKSVGRNGLCNDNGINQLVDLFELRATAKV